MQRIASKVGLIFVLSILMSLFLVGTVFGADTIVAGWKGTKGWDGAEIQWQLNDGVKCYLVNGWRTLEGKDELVFTLTYLVLNNTMNNSENVNITGLTSVEDGIVTFKATQSGRNYFSLLSSAEYWFDIGIVSDLNSKDVKNVYKSEKVTKAMLENGYKSTSLNAITPVSEVQFENFKIPTNGQIYTTNDAVLKKISDANSAPEVVGVGIQKHSSKNDFKSLNSYVTSI